MPPNPLLGIQASVVRRARLGKVVSPEQAISVAQALGLYGPTAARVSGLGGRVGTIKKGALADFAILDRDPTTVPPEEISGIGVWATILGGRVVRSGTGARAKM